MINKDYILRFAERIGRSLAIILGLREYNKHEEALIYIDDLLLQSTGLTSTFINSLPNELLLQTLSPLGTLNIEKSLWIASLLKAEGEIHEEKGDSNSAYYRYQKALLLFLAVLQQEPALIRSEFADQIEELLQQLSAYELPTAIKQQLFHYFDLTGQYGRAEDMLFEVLEADHNNTPLIEQGKAFYQRLLKKHDADLIAGNLSREEVQEGYMQLQHMQQ